MHIKEREVRRRRWGGTACAPVGAAESKRCVAEGMAEQAGREEEWRRCIWVVGGLQVCNKRDKSFFLKFSINVNVFWQGYNLCNG